MVNTKTSNYSTRFLSPWSWFPNTPGFQCCRWPLVPSSNKIKTETVPHCFGANHPVKPQASTQAPDCFCRSFAGSVGTWLASFRVTTLAKRILGPRTGSGSGTNPTCKQKSNGPQTKEPAMAHRPRSSPRPVTAEKEHLRGCRSWHQSLPPRFWGHRTSKTSLSFSLAGV